MKSPACCSQFLAGVVATGVALALAAASTPAQNSERALGVSVNPDREAYYGDLHLHTTYSFDAFLNRAAQSDPEVAYRFARGGVGRFLDQEIERTSPPLDFMAVTDHAEFLGVLNALDEASSTPSQRQYLDKIRKRDSQTMQQLREKSLPGVNSDAMTQSAWQRTIDAANRFYEPGKFTTFIGYEWTAMPDGNTLHRNVIFRGDTAPNPFSADDSAKPEALWAYLENIRKRGYEALAIPHNANQSNGLMFDWVNSDGMPIDQSYAEMRAANEPLVELSQSKGQSETHPLLSPNDEFSGFEILESVVGSSKGVAGGSYVRDALGRGLIVSRRTGGVNPFKFGFVGGSDFHNGLSEAAETAYAGAIVGIDPRLFVPVHQWLERRWLERSQQGAEPSAKRRLYALESGSGNLTGVWAERNTRDSIYAALRRKETFATSGTRLKFRFFGGWDIDAAILKHEKWVTAAYRRGVSMGGDLPRRPMGKRAPRFIAWAVKDPNGANLDRLQAVKVWLKEGEHREKVFDVAVSNQRKIDPRTGKAPEVGNTVDVERGTYSNTIGATELTAFWSDPDFDPDTPAVYYLRVLEIPTPRWSTIVAAKTGEPRPEHLPTTIQERGWSSPIWYVPNR